MKKLLLMPVAVALCVIIAGHSVQANTKPHRETLPNFDQRDVAAAKARATRNSPPIQASAAAHLQTLLPGAKVERDPLFGAPRFVSAASGFLTGPNGEGRGVSAATARTVAANDPHRAVKAFVNEHAALFGHGAAALESARLKREYTTAHNSLRTTVWEQQLDGVTVFEAVFAAHVTKKGELVNVASQFIPEPAQAADNANRNRAAQINNPTITAQEALTLAAKNLGDEMASSAVQAVKEQSEGTERKQRFTGPAVRHEAEARLVWLPMDRSTMRLCWELILTSKSRGEMFRVLIDATTGDALVRHCLTSYASDATYRVYTSDSPTPFSPGHSTPNTGQPAPVPRELVVTNAFNTNASPNGWIDDGVNETRGNNVDAHTDHDANDLPDLPRPQGSPNRVFDFPMDLTQSPATYSSAAVVQLFYLCNMIHDRFYELGFTEEAGNFQVDNFGRGGVGNDAVQADAQDGDGFNNANFSTPPDGSSGRMQMFIFNGPNPDIDGDFDAEIVIHEYTHGLSNRRVGNGVGISRLATAGMGEGWSDFYGLCLLSDAGDDVDANYAAGGYATRNFYGLQENYYYGIRRYPYTTDMSKNPLTFRDIDPSQFSSHPGVPVSPIGAVGFPQEVHNQGEVWCVTLWEARANLIKKHGFAVGNQLILRLVTDGMGLGPANPNFVEARDGILLADRVLTGGANQTELWSAFAKRGLGAFATAPESSTTTGVRESFDLPDDLLVLPLGDLSTTGPIGGPFSVSRWIFTLANSGTNSLGFSVLSGGLIETESLSGTLAPGGSSLTITARLSTAAANLPLGVYTDSLRFSNTVSGVTQSRVLTLRVGQPSFFTELFESGSNDLNNITITLTPDGSASFYDACRETATAFPTSLGGSTPLSLTDDSYVELELDGAEVSIFGKKSSKIFVGSNGYITLDRGDNSLSESFTSHFSLPRVAALFLDLNPAAGGSMSWQQLHDRIAVSWLNVPEYSRSNRNSFQIELFLDGRIRTTHLRIDADYGLVGVSAGNGIPPGFEESDWSSFGTCLPRIAVTVPALVSESAGLLAGAGMVSLDQPSSGNVAVFLVSTDPSKVTVPSLVTIPAGATNATFDLTINDDAQVNGTVRVRVTANAAGRRPGSGFITVSDNEVAALTVSLPSSAREGDGLLPHAGVVTVNPAPDRALLIPLVSSDTNELSVPNGLAIVPAGQTSATFALQVVDDRRLDGPQPAGITAAIEGWTSAGATMTVLDNESTNLGLSMIEVVSEGSGTVTNAGIVFLSGTALSNVTVSLASQDLTEITVPAEVTVPAGQSFGRFNLTVVDDSILDNTQTVVITASAPGFADASGTTRVTDNEFPVAPFFPNPTAFALGVALDADLSWSSGEGEQIINGDFELGEFVGWTREGTGLGSFAINNGTFDPESEDGPIPPFAGSYSALCRQQGAGRRTLSQDVIIPSGATSATLSWVDRIRNHAPDFTSNHRFAVEIEDLPSAARTVLFQTQSGHPLFNDWTNRTVDLAAFRGRTIRVTFTVQDELGFLNVHLDNVSLIIGSPAPTAYDVYFGINPAPGEAELLGTTTNSTWALPALDQLTTYYWQVVSKRGPATVPGPVWNFTTRGSTSQRTLVRAGSVWKYLDDGSNQGTFWRDNAYDDSEWAQGPARLGYGGDGEVTRVGYGPDANNKYITTYFRHYFSVTNASSYLSLVGRIARDDGAVVYLNGTEVIRENMFFGFLDYRTEAISTINSPNETALIPYDIAPGLLLEGLNVLAIEIHQVSASSSDMGMDFDLVGITRNITNQLPSITITNPLNYARFNTPATVVIGADATDADGTIRRVEFYANTNRLGEDTVAPFSFTWANPPAGPHTLTAVATDSGGATNISAPVSIVVSRSGNQPITAVQFGASWRYLDDGTDQGTAWTSTNFNDQAWLQGSAELGYGDGDEATVVSFGPDPNNRYITTYFRHTFTNSATFATLTASLIRDDGAVVYLNGVEVFRSNMPTGPINYQTLAASTVNVPQESQPNSSAVNPTLLRRGRNVIAVEVHQREINSTDLSFNLELSGFGNSLPSVTLTAPVAESTFTAPPNVSLAAAASDRYGTIARVDFFAGPTLLGSDTTSPFGLQWQPPAGNHTLTAVATDNSGGTNRSAPVIVTILPPPSLTATRAGASLTLAWPATAYEFSLESAASLTTPLLWSPVTNPVINANGEFKTSLGAGQTNQYFRLIRP